MQFLSEEECRAWAEACGFRVNAAFGHPIEGELASRHRFRIPADAGARVALARVLWESVAAGRAETLLWVTSWGIWPSGEHRPIVESVRRDLGGSASLDDTPGTLVRLGEGEGGLSLFVLAILFLWDCWLLPVGGRQEVFISHDEYGAVNASGDPEILRRLRALAVLEESSNSDRAV